MQPVPQDADLELRHRKETRINEQIVAMSSAEEEPSIQKVISAENFSDLKHLFRVTSYVQRFIVSYTIVEKSDRRNLGS